MTKEEVISVFKAKPMYLNMGAGKLAKQFKCSKDVIYEARAIVRKNMKEFGTTYHPKEVAFKPVENKHRLLFIDIETSPILNLSFRVWKANIRPEQILSDWYCISWSAKWAGESEMINGVLTPEEALNEDDSRIMIDLWNVLNSADTVVSHNGISFDHKRINTRFIMNGLPPTRPVRIIDTLKVVKDNFAFTSNKLDAILVKFGLDKKLDTDFNLWRDCVHGNPEALTRMSEYNDWDVISLERAFQRLRPWIKNFPNYVLYNDVDDANVCPTCGGKHLIEDGIYTTVNNKYVLYRCTDCGCISRNRKAEKTIVKITNNIR